VFTVGQHRIAEREVRAERQERLGRKDVDRHLGLVLLADAAPEVGQAVGLKGGLPEDAIENVGRSAEPLPLDG
jgi:hypothetical protein